MKAQKNEREMARRILRLQLILCGHAARGLRLKDIAEALGTIPSTALHDLDTMRDEGFAERIPNMEERWRLGPKGIQIWYAHAQEMQREHEALDRFHHNCTRAPK